MSYGEVVSAAAAAPFAAGYLAADPVYSIIRQFIGTSAGSTVAIDNKIEQAMDLVKSHLMFAVREEVDVLKEKITELLDRIAQLEYENGILRAGASPETLSLLAQSAQQAVPVSQPQLPQPQQTIAAVAAAVAQPVVIPPQPVVVPPQQQQQQAPVASVQPVPMQPAPVQPQIPQLVTVVQQPQQLTHQQPQPQPSQPVQLQHQPQLPQQQQKQPLQQPPPT